MKSLVLLLSILTLPMFQSQANAESGKTTLRFETIRCNFFGKLEVKAKGINRKMNVSKNDLKCRTAMDELLKAINKGGNKFEATISHNEEIEVRCSKGGSDNTGPCNTFRLYYMNLSAPQLKFNGRGFEGEILLDREII